MAAVRPKFNGLEFGVHNIVKPALRGLRRWAIVLPGVLQIHAVGVDYR